jgi:hypothetical protein
MLTPIAAWNKAGTGAAPGRNPIAGTGTYL